MFGFVITFKNFLEKNFSPKLYEVMKSGYSKEYFKRDIMSGLTVAIISLPLAMAFAIAAGVSPDKGLYTAIIAGFIISFFGGSRYQIGGPTGAFVIIIFNIVAEHSYTGLLMAMVIAGILLIVAGLLRLGSYIKYVPYPVIIGFTSGIAILLFSTQIKDLVGLQMENVPAEVLPKWIAYFASWNTFSVASIVVSVVTFSTIMFIDIKKPKLPAYLIGLTVATLIVVVLVAFNVPIDTIESKFGALPVFLPKPEFPEFNMQLAFKVFPSALTIAFLTAIESLLSATIIDGMSGDNHNSNAELIAGGVATIATASFGGIPATGAIARTSANYRAKAYSPMSGVIHAIFLLLFLLVLSPVAKYVPLSALSVVLIIIAFNMFGFKKFYDVMKISRGERITLIVTFLLTVFVDLNAAISIGFMLSSIMFMHSMSKEVEVEAGDAAEAYRKDYEQGGSDMDEDLVERGVLSLRFSGPLFFGVVSDISNMFKKIENPKILILRMSRVNVVDASGVNALVLFLKRMMKEDTKIVVAGIRKQPQRLMFPVLKDEGIYKNISFSSSFKNSIALAKRHLKEIEKDANEEVIDEESVKEVVKVAVKEAEVAAKEAVKEAKEAAQIAMKEAKEAAQLAVKEAKETVKGIEEAAKIAVKEAEEEAKEVAKKALEKKEGLEVSKTVNKEVVKDKIASKVQALPLEDKKTEQLLSEDDNKEAAAKENENQVKKKTMSKKKIAKKVSKKTSKKASKSKHKSK